MRLSQALPALLLTTLAVSAEAVEPADTERALVVDISAPIESSLREIRDNLRNITPSVAQEKWDTFIITSYDGIRPTDSVFTDYSAFLRALDNVTVSGRPYYPQSVFQNLCPQITSDATEGIIMDYIVVDNRQWMAGATSADPTQPAFDIRTGLKKCPASSARLNLLVLDTNPSDGQSCPLTMENAGVTNSLGYRTISSEDGHITWTCVLDPLQISAELTTQPPSPPAN